MQRYKYNQGQGKKKKPKCAVLNFLLLIYFLHLAEIHCFSLFQLSAVLRPCKRAHTSGAHMCIQLSWGSDWPAHQHKEAPYQPAGRICSMINMFHP